MQSRELGSQSRVLIQELQVMLEQLVDLLGKGGRSGRRRHVTHQAQLRLRTMPTWIVWIVSG